MGCSAGRRCIWAVCFLWALQIAAGVQFKVGGQNGWATPSEDNGESFGQWAQKNRFRRGDSLLFKYPAKEDSVLEVTAQDFASCNRSSPIASFNDGNTVFQFTRSGPFYFISGAEGHCEKGQKIVVVVMSEGRRGGAVVSPAGAPIVAAPALSPSALPAEEGPASSPTVTPAVAPTSDASALVRPLVGGLLGPLVGGLLGFVGFFMVL